MQESIQQQNDLKDRHVKDGMLSFNSTSDSSFHYLNINAVHDERLTIGQRVADAVAAGMGSWWFIIVQSSILATWIVLNTVQLIFKRCKD